MQIPKKVTDRQKELLKEFEEVQKEVSTDKEKKSQSFIADAYKRLKDFMGVNKKKGEAAAEKKTETT